MTRIHHEKLNFSHLLENQTIYRDLGVLFGVASLIVPAKKVSILYGLFSGGFLATAWLGKQISYDICSSRLLAMQEMFGMLGLAPRTVQDEFVNELEDEIDKLSRSAVADNEVPKSWKDHTEEATRIYISRVVNNLLKRPK